MEDSTVRTLFVVSGGDAPGINDLILRYTSYCTDADDLVFGSLGGFAGLLAGAVIPLTYQTLLPWIGRAGTILPSSREPVLSQPTAESTLKQVLATFQIDQMILFGGDGTLRHIPPLLAKWGVPCVGLPTTIDNDVPGTELSLGFDSACNYAYRTIDGIVATAHALNGRMFMVETLGGTNGNLALAVAQGAGATVVLVPEYAYDMTWLATRMKSATERFGFGLLILCEGTPGARTLAEDLPRLTGIRMRDIRLGHAQRGAEVSHRDRSLAAEWAYLAYQAVHAQPTTGNLLVQNGKTIFSSEARPSTLPLPDRTLYDRINGFDAAPARSNGANT
jgi:6-phosphofructokinase 1